MSTLTKERLHQLVNALPEQEIDTAARVLEALNGLEPGESPARAEVEEAAGDSVLMTAVEVRRQFGPAAVIVGAPPLTSIDELYGDFWPENEPADEFDVTIRRWRDADRRG